VLIKGSSNPGKKDSRERKRKKRIPISERTACCSYEPDLLSGGGGEAPAERRGDEKDHISLASWMVEESSNFRGKKKGRALETPLTYPQPRPNQNWTKKKSRPLHCQLWVTFRGEAKLLLGRTDCRGKEKKPSEEHVLLIYSPPNPPPPNPTGKKKINLPQKFPAPR